VQNKRSSGGIPSVKTTRRQPNRWLCLQVQQIIYEMAVVVFLFSGFSNQRFATPA